MRKLWTSGEAGFGGGSGEAGASRGRGVRRWGEWEAVAAIAGAEMPAYSRRDWVASGWEVPWTRATRSITEPWRWQPQQVQDRPVVAIHPERWRSPCLWPPALGHWKD
jgi:hypothetical protein